MDVLNPSKWNIRNLIRPTISAYHSHNPHLVVNESELLL